MAQQQTKCFLRGRRWLCPSPHPLVLGPRSPNLNNSNINVGGRRVLRLSSCLLLKRYFSACISHTRACASSTQHPQAKRHQNRGRELNTNLFSPGISWQNPGISRKKSLVCRCFEGHTKLFGPHPFTGRPPPHRKISGPKSLSLGLGSFFFLDRRKEEGGDGGVDGGRIPQKKTRRFWMRFLLCRLRFTLHFLKKLFNKRKTQCYLSIHTLSLYIYTIT